MLTMSKNEERKYFRTTPEFRGLLGRLKANLVSTKVFSDRHGYTSDDAVMNALLLWANDDDIEKVAATLRPYLERFEKAWDGVLAAKKEDEVGEKNASSSGAAATLSRRSKANDYTSKKRTSKRRKPSSTGESENVPVGNNEEFEPDDVP